MSDTLYQQLAEKVEEQGQALSSHVDQVAVELAKHQEALRLRSEEEETRYDKLRCLIERQADTADKKSGTARVSDRGDSRRCAVI